MSDAYYMINHNRERSCDKYIYFEEYPKIKMGQEKLEKRTVPGKGNVYQHTGTYEDTEITLMLDINTLLSPDSRDEAEDKARKYLMEMKTLQFCDEPQFYYIVKEVEIGEIDRYSEDSGDCEVKILCDPWKYHVDGGRERTIKEASYNPLDICHPVYIIKGNGFCRLTVNGKYVDADVTDRITIDTERMITYRDRGTELLNTRITGNYEDLYLKEGENSITVSSGYTVTIVPNWRRK